MELICKCFGYGHQEHGEVDCAQGSNSSNPFSQNEFSKFKQFFHRGQVEAEASSSEGGVAATTTPTAMASQTLTIESKVQTLNEANTGNNTSPQRTGSVQQGLKPLAKEGKQSKAKIYSLDMVPSSNDEDVCPTCLEEYDVENPKIITQCNHHYHLACIFEWMERSPSCPFCGKMMVFEQMT